MKFSRLALLFCLLLSPQQAASARESLNIATGEYRPWTSEHLKHYGFTNHVVREAFKLVGYDVTFTFFPWKRAYEIAKDGKSYQATSYWYPSEGGEQDFFYSVPLQIDRMVFFHLVDKKLPNWNSLSDFKGIRIGATRGYTYTQEFWDAQKSGHLNIQVANSDQVNFNKLLNRRIDIFPAEKELGQQLLISVFGSDIALSVGHLKRPLVEPSGHLLVSRRLENGAELVKQFNTGLTKLKESGRYRQLQVDLLAGKYLP